MRNVFAFAVFALAACSGNNAANNAAVVGESGDTEVTPLNDTTAIDADMAADVNYTIDENEMNETANSTESKSSSEKPVRKAEKPAPSYEPDEPGMTPSNNTAD